MKFEQTTTQVQGQRQGQKPVQRPSPKQLQQQKMLCLQAQEMMHAIEEALEKNLFLEVSEPAEGDVDYAEPEAPINDNDGDDPGNDGDGDDEGQEEQGNDAEGGDREDDADDETSEERDRISPGEIFGSLRFEDDDNEDELPPSLLIPDDFETRYDEWYSEILCTPRLNDEERFTAAAIVGDLLPNGMLETSLADVAMVCQVDMPVAERALAFVQSLSPAGVGARDVIEYLSLQLDRISSPNADKARTILSAWRTASEEFVPELASADNGTDSPGKSGKKGRAGMDRIRDNAIKMSSAVLGRLREFSGLSDEDFRDGARLLVRLRLPGSVELDVSDQFVPEVEIVPDHNGKLVADYIPGPWSRLWVNDSLLGAFDSAKLQQYYKKKLDAANEFKDSIQFRMDTVTALAQLVADVQWEFLKTGDKSKIVPFSEKDAAEKLGLDTSTISRAAKDKLVKTPVGIMPMKEFFVLSTPSRLAAAPGEAPVTNDVIMEKVREVIESEPEGKPYSDQKIADILNKRGIKIARRTVEKYRNNLGIGNASQRRKAPRR